MAGESASSDRVAELKRKMQEAAQRAKAEAASKEAATPAVTAPAAPAPAAPAPVAVADTAEIAPAAAAVVDEVAAAEPAVPPAAAPSVAHVAPVASAPAPAAVARAVAPVAAPAASPAPSTNGAEPVIGSADPALPVDLSPEELAKREMTRRELLTYAWGGALALVGAASGFGIFEFMYPRFRAGEFGGKFIQGNDFPSVPAAGAPPLAVSSGKFWLFNSETEGIKAIYMVCTHLGCLYKWEPSTVRFECPCHGSKFTADGFYIEGPAPRSLDTFTVSEENGLVVVDTGAKTTGSPSTESPARAAV